MKCVVIFVLQAVDFNIFEGMVVHGVPVVVISQGRMCVQNGKVSQSAETEKVYHSRVSVYYFFVGVHLADLLSRCSGDNYIDH